MKQKYGVSVAVPDRAVRPRAHVADGAGPRRRVPDGASRQLPGARHRNLNCTNPLFAATLPPDGDVGTGPVDAGTPTGPNDALQPARRHADDEPRLLRAHRRRAAPAPALRPDERRRQPAEGHALTDADWAEDPREGSREATTTRASTRTWSSRTSRAGGRCRRSGFTVADPPQPDRDRPDQRARWVTDRRAGTTISRRPRVRVHLQAHRLDRNPAPRSATAATTADPTLTDSCDCPPPAGGRAPYARTAPAGLRRREADQQAARRRTRRSASSTPRSSWATGIVSSICPIDTATTPPTRSALRVSPGDERDRQRARRSPGDHLLAAPLTIDPKSHEVPCLVLGTFPRGYGEPRTCSDPILGRRLDRSDTDILRRFKADRTRRGRRRTIVGAGPDDRADVRAEAAPAERRLQRGRRARRTGRRVVLRRHQRDARLPASDPVHAGRPTLRRRYEPPVPRAAAGRARFGRRGRLTRAMPQDASPAASRAPCHTLPDDGMSTPAHRIHFARREYLALEASTTSSTSTSTARSTRWRGVPPNTRRLLRRRSGCFSAAARGKMPGP